MTSTSRSVVGAIFGLLVFVSGFWLQFHATEFMNYTDAGVQVAPYAHVFQKLANCLMYTGAGLVVLATVVWMLSGSRPPITGTPPAQG